MMTIFLLLQTAALFSFGLSVLIPRSWRRWWRLTAVCVFFGVPFFRISYIAFKKSSLHYETIGTNVAGQFRYAKYLDALLDERDVVRLGAEAYLKFRDKSAPVAADFAQQLASLLGEVGWLFPSPAFSTLLKMQTPEHFQLIRFDAPTAASAAPLTANTPATVPVPTSALPAIFLHGLGGNLTVQCWMVAKILRQKGYTTYCPSMGIISDWWSDDGLAILKQTIDVVQKAAPNQQILFAGLSNGAVGLVQHAGALTNASGFIMISGGRPAVTSMPKRTLLITGTEDELFPLTVARVIKLMSPFNVTLEELPSDHFLLARRNDEVGALILKWLP